MYQRQGIDTHLIKVVMTLSNPQSWIRLLITSRFYSVAQLTNFVKNLLHNPYQYFITRVQFWLFLAFYFWWQPHLCQLYHFNHLLSIGIVQDFRLNKSLDQTMSVACCCVAIIPKVKFDSQNNFEPILKRFE